MAVTYSYQPLGSEFLVNTNTQGEQTSPHVTGINNGGFVVTWTDESGTLGDNSFYSVKGQVYDFRGAKVGTEFLVNTTTTDSQFRSQVTFLNESGGFVVSWIGTVDGDNDPNGIGAQVFAADGSKVGEEILVNTIIDNNQNFADISFGGDGFVVTWTDNSQMSADTFGTAILAQRFTEAGIRIGPEFLANTTFQGGEEQSSVTGLMDGGFVITWVDTNNAVFGDSDAGIQGQVFNASGGKVGSEFLVNTSTPGIQRHPDITWLVNGGFVVAWEDNSGTLGDSSGTSVKAQIFNADGTKSGTEFLVNTATADDQYNVAVAPTANGFVVSWRDESNTAPDTSLAVRAQIYDLSGTPVGSEFLLATNTAFTQDSPSLSLLTNRAFVAVWADASQTLGDSSGFSVKGQMYQRMATGDAADDSVTAPGGVSTLDLHGGVDTVTFSFNLTDATVTYSGNSVVITTVNSQTTITGAERFVFSDGTVENNDGNPLVDDLFYYSHNHDVWNAKSDADSHFATFGWKEGRDPSAFFDTSFYLSVYQDVKASGANPLQHFDSIGWKQGRLPSPDFDPAAYLKNNPDVAASGVDPLRHYLESGYQEGRLPVPGEVIAANGFDYGYYLASNPDVAAAGIDPFVHFQTVGWKEGRNPNALFDTKGYLATYTDVKDAGVNPLDHYHQSGWKEGRDPGVSFDTTSYLSAYPDVQAVGVDPLIHFLDFGRHEGRMPFGEGIWG